MQVKLGKHWATEIFNQIISRPRASSLYRLKTRPATQTRVKIENLNKFSQFLISNCAAVTMHDHCINLFFNRSLTLLCFRYDVAALGFITTDQTGKLRLETVGMNTKLSCN